MGSDMSPYPENPGQTHYPGCWLYRGHHNCAVAEIERLRADFKDALYVVQEKNAEVARLREALRNNIRTAARRALHKGGQDDDE